MRVALAFCLAAFVETALAGQIPSLPKGADAVLRTLPSLDSLTKGTPPLTTDFDDTIGPVAFKTDPAAMAKKLTDLPRAADGGFTLRPGLWEGTFQSYCLAPATYAPGGGDGYRRAGRKAAAGSSTFRSGTSRRRRSKSATTITPSASIALASI